MFQFHQREMLFKERIFYGIYQRKHKSHLQRQTISLATQHQEKEEQNCCFLTIG